jgi:pimeloyl-ACP methyl ester carboxylesterase
VTTSLPIVLVPGLLTTPRLYGDQLPYLWRLGPVTIAGTTYDDSIAAMAGRILADAPPRFALAGLSMGGYVAFEIMRRAAGRVAGLALLDTSAHPDGPEQTERRRAQIALAGSGRFDEIVDQLFPLFVHPDRMGDRALYDLVREMAGETGLDAFVRQQIAIMGRPDSRPGLAAIDCPTLVVVGDDDRLTPPSHSIEIADRIPGARLVTVPECGHLCTVERPEFVTGALVDWLTRLIR